MTDRALVQDLRSLDRDVGRAHAAWAKWRAALSLDPEAHADQDPLARFRHVASKSTYDALGELAPVSFEISWKEGLMRWIAALVQARLLHGDDVALERARLLPVGILQLEEGRHVSSREAWRGLVHASSRNAAMAWLDAAGQSSGEIASVVRERAARRVEIAGRLGLPPHPLVSASQGELFARGLLDATEDLWRATLGEAAKKDDLAFVARSPVDAPRMALAAAAGEGWPAHLSSRWLSEMFEPHLRGVSIRLPPLAPAVGASSFARALESFGRAFRSGADARGIPFAIAQDPYFVDVHRVGLVFGALASSPPFQSRMLGTSARVSALQSRLLARTSLFEARLRAMRFLFAAESRAVPSDLFEEMTHRLFGVSLPPAMANAWPLPCDDEPARLLALATALPLARDLVDRFDDDWFRNPRAFEALRSRGATPAREEAVEITPAMAVSLGRAFEDSLG